MVSRRRIALLASLALVLIGGSVLYGTVLDPAPPTLTVDNEAQTTYRVTAYTVDSRDEAMYMNFEVRTRRGERRLVTLSQLIWPDEYRNVTLTDDGIPTQRLSVAPGAEVTTTIDGWRRGNVTVYIAEELGGNETHVYTRIQTCTRPGQEHSLTFEGDGSTSGSSTCSGGWL